MRTQGEYILEIEFDSPDIQGEDLDLKLLVSFFADILKVKVKEKSGTRDEFPVDRVE